MDSLNREQKVFSYLVGRFGKDDIDANQIPKLESCPKNSLVIEYKSELTKDDSSLPEITCLCPTYGRFEWLKNSIACFLMQDYPKKRLMICNDHPIKINTYLLPQNIQVINCNKRFPNLGEKRQFMLESAETELVAHWDDDDIYMPWHLLHTTKYLLHFPRMKMVRLHPALFVEIRSNNVRIKKECGWEHEAMDVFYKKNAIDIGGYAKTNLQEAVALQGKFIDNHMFLRINSPAWKYSFLYNRYDLKKHLCQNQDDSDSCFSRFDDMNRDTGNLTSLIDSDNYMKWAQARMYSIVSSYLLNARSEWGEAAHVLLSKLFLAKVSI